MKKYLILAIFAMLSVVTAQVTDPVWVDVGYEQKELDYDTYSWMDWGVAVADGDTAHVEFRTHGLKVSNSVLYMKVTPYPNTTAPDPTASVDVSCPFLSGTIELDTFNNWVGDGWVFDWLDLYSGNIEQTVFTANDEEAYIDGSGTCNFTANNQDLFINFYALLVGGDSFQCPECDRYSVPNEALGNVVNRVESTVVAAFNLIDMLIMVAGFILVVFIIIMIYRLFRNFTRRE